MATSEKILDEALERFEESDTVSSFNRQQAAEDIKFSRLGDQWPDAIKKQRQEENRPCLTINRLPSFIRQVVNESRQNKPSINVHPVDGGSDVETARIIGGLIRNIQRRSNADIAYDTAIDHAVSGGFGFFRIGIDYINEQSFALEARIHRVPNPLMVHWDTNTMGFDASDWEYAFVSEMLTEREFKKRYPKADPVSFEGNEQDSVANWTDGEGIRVAEYWSKSDTEVEIVLLSDGRVVKARDLPKLAKSYLASGGMDLGGMIDDDQIVAAVMQITGVTEVKRRMTREGKVTRRIINGVEVLEEEVWPGRTIPICPVWGEEVVIDGKRHLRSMIRDARDPQTMFNFWRSATTELVALAPRAPYLIPVGGIPKGQEGIWQTANSRSHAYLEYNPAAGIPQRQTFAGVPAGALQEALNAADDMKAITGIYDASLGARSNETSGRAISARQRQGSVANFHFIDNLNRAIEYCGRCLVDVIPSVYGPQETVRILGDDSKEEVARLTHLDPSAFPQQDGERLYNLSVGTYDVSVTTGPNYTTQREETREVLIEMMRSVPGSAAVLGDALLENMDFPGAEKIAKRLQMMLPPQIQQAEGIIAPQPPVATPQPGQGQPMPQQAMAMPNPAVLQNPMGVAR